MRIVRMSITKELIDRAYQPYDCINCNGYATYKDRCFASNQDGYCINHQNLMKEFEEQMRELNDNNLEERTNE